MAAVLLLFFSGSENTDKIDKSHDNILRNYGIGAQILNDIGVKKHGLIK